MQTTNAPAEDIAVQAGAGAGRAGRTRSFRPDVEGLRAVAITLVVLYHAGLPPISGGYVGVDVFFVISGFVITLTLIRELGRHGRISIAGFYARRVTRLLPAATVVVVVTLVASWLWVSPLLVPSIAHDALACTLYFVNYRLASVSVDYFATGAPSPFQHFWSLAVEEQFYIVWPLLLATLLVGWRFASRHRSPRAARTAAALVVLIAGSFALCVWLTRHSLPWAYFSAPTRAWELGLGALVAVGSAWLARMRAPLAAALTWVGLAGIVASALWFTDATVFPGSAAMLPVASTALVIAAGCANPARGAESLLRTPVFQGIGKVSYSWYLWHWPVFVIAPAVLGAGLATWTRLLLAAGSLALAMLSFRYLEDPIRTARALKAVPWRAIVLGASLSGSAAVVAVLVATATPPAAMGPPVPDLPQAIAPPSTTGPNPTPLPPAQLAEFERQLFQAIADGLHVRELPSNLTPALKDAPTDIPRIYPDHCDAGYSGTSVHTCMYGSTSSSTSVVLYGDSHAGQWFPPVESIARKYHWKLIVITKSGCTLADVPTYSSRLKREYAECDQWRHKSLAVIRSLHPAMVLFTSTHGTPMVNGDPARIWADGWRTTIGQLRADGTRLVLIRDTPQARMDVPLCLSSHLRDADACDASIAQAFPSPGERATIAATATEEGVTVVDPAPWFCATDSCPVVVGNILVFKDVSHMTTAYANLLTPVLESAIVPA